jgi:hypothetical protein
MKELLTKKFWQDVKKTFEEAQEDPPAAPPAPKPETAPAPEAPTS